MKKTIFCLSTLLLAACTKSVSDTPFPAEFVGADYILSDNQAKLWIAESEQARLCIYPNLTRIQQAHFSKEDAYIHSQYVFFYPLEKAIGEQYVKMVQDDEKSMNYAQYQFKRWKNEPADIKPLSSAQCEQLKSQARDDLAVVKGEYKSGMAEENKPTENNKNSDGVATNQNKFFFDIIKWGSALLL